MNKSILCIVTLLLLGTWTWGQGRTITGTVFSSSGDPVPFATIQVKSSTVGTSADDNGHFSIQAQIGETLVVSATGYLNKEVTIASSNVQVTLELSGGELSEVVVTALGIKRQAKSIGYSTGSISQQDLTESKSFNLAQSLTNKVSGLVVYNTSASVDASPRVVLRGLRSMTGDNTALVVLDGVAVPSNTLSYINPNDVADISVMKGGQAATLFGSDGVNGAIIITTKKGTTRKPEITLSNSYNVEELSYLPKFQTGWGSGSAYGADPHEDFHPAENQQYGDAFDGSTRHPGRVLANGDFLTFPYSYVPGLHESFWDRGNTNQTDFSYRSGNETSNVFTSYQRVTSNGIVPGDSYERNSLRLNASNTFNRFNISFDATYTFDKADRTNTDYYFYSLNSPGWVPMSQFRDWKTNEFGDLDGYFNDYYLNPYWLLDNSRFKPINHYFNGNITGKFKVNNDLSITARIGMANTEFSQQVTANNYSFSTWAKSAAYLIGYNRDYDYFLTGSGFFKARTPIPGSLSDSYSNGNRLNTDVFVTYNKKFSDFSLNALAGNNIQVRKGRAIGVGTSSIALHDYFNLVNSATGLYNGSDSLTEQRKAGGYVDATVGYRDFLFLHGSARHDWTSVFYQPGRSSDLYQYTTWGGDVSFSIFDALPAWKTDILSFAKVRASYNQNRNDNVGPYSLDQTYSFAAGFPFQGFVGMTAGGTIPFPTLSAEKVSSSEVGVELGFWNNRISLEASYYRQIADQQILNADVSPATGIQGILTNAARVNNHGLDAELKTNLIRSRDWRLDVNLSYTYNTNKVTNLYVEGFSALQYQTAGNYNLNAELNQMFPYLKVSAYERDPEGKIVVDPESGLPNKSPDLMGVGNTMPKQLFGVDLNVSWKRFSLQANAEYRGDYVVYNDLGGDMMFTGTSAISTIYGRQQFLWPNSVYEDPNNAHQYLANTGYATSQYSATYHGFGDLSNGSSVVNVGEMLYSSGDFWKLRSVALSYDFDMTKFGKVSNTLKGVKLTAWGRNLKTWLAADNWFTDPEFSNTNGNSIGINNTLNTPPTRQWGGTITVTF